MLLTRRTANAAECGVENFVAAGQRPGMRCGRLGSLRRAAGLDHDDRLVQSDFTRRGQERARIADRFHVNHDAARVGIVAEVIDEVSPTDIHHRSYGDEGAEADLLLQAPVENGRTESAALADETDTARPRDSVCKGGVEARHGAHDAQTVRPHDADVGFASFGQNLVFQCNSARAGLFEARRNDDRAFDTLLGAFADHTGNGRGRGHDYGQIDLVRNVFQAGIRLDSENVGTLGIDRIDRAPKRDC